jgi:signal transduction histidine kinase
MNEQIAMADAVEASITVHWSAHEGTGADEVSRRARTEREMEALVRVAGDVSHKLNNALGIVLGFGELLQTHLAEDPTGLVLVREILGASEQGRQAVSLLLRAAQPMPRKDWPPDCQ